MSGLFDGQRVLLLYQLACFGCKLSPAASSGTILSNTTHVKFRTLYLSFIRPLKTLIISLNEIIDLKYTLLENSFVTSWTVDRSNSHVICCIHGSVCHPSRTRNCACVRASVHVSSSVLSIFATFCDLRNSFALFCDFFLIISGSTVSSIVRRG